MKSFEQVKFTRCVTTYISFCVLYDISQHICTYYAATMGLEGAYQGLEVTSRKRHLPTTF